MKDYVALASTDRMLLAVLVRIRVPDDSFSFQRRAPPERERLLSPGELNGLYECILLMPCHFLIERERCGNRMKEDCHGRPGPKHPSPD